mmetsp:Transcript_92808/g.267990  ORF Transcript_92808/g.267990 Transcript_92808/m.267990 type:complete len:208 (-) Transcript_92808:971-1594(-)
MFLAILFAKVQSVFLSFIAARNSPFGGPVFGERGSEPFDSKESFGRFRRPDDIPCGKGTRRTRNASGRPAASSPSMLVTTVAPVIVVLFVRMAPISIEPPGTIIDGNGPTLLSSEACGFVPALWRASERKASRRELFKAFSEESKPFTDSSRIHVQMFSCVPMASPPSSCFLLLLQSPSAVANSWPCGKPMVSALGHSGSRTRKETS